MKYPASKSVQNATLVGTWGQTKIKIFDVPDMQTLNQFVGYIKHINAGEGNVLYRGQYGLFEKLTPNILHFPANIEVEHSTLVETIKRIRQDTALMEYFNFADINTNGWKKFEEIAIEATLQHYGAKTHCVDFVDNHWTALWFGANKYSHSRNKYEIRNENKNINQNDIAYIVEDDNYKKIQLPPKPILDEIELNAKTIEYLQRIVQYRQESLEALVEKRKSQILKDKLKEWSKEVEKITTHNIRYKQMLETPYTYLILYLAEANAPCFNGMYFGKKTYVVDLRKVLPSTFLRPSAQHGWIVRGVNINYEFNEDVICVIRVPLEATKEMLGNGRLLSQENFFPNRKIDGGYDILLGRQAGTANSTKHEVIIPYGMIQELAD